MFEPWQLELLERCRVGRLATIGASGVPHLVPVCYALVDGAVVIAIDEKPKRSVRGLARLRNIARDPRAVLLIDHWDEDWSQLAWVRIEGSADVVAEGREQPAALAALRARYPQYLAMDLEARPLIRVAPSRLTGWRPG